MNLETIIEMDEIWMVEFLVDFNFILQIETICFGDLEHINLLECVEISIEFTFDLNHLGISSGPEYRSVIEKINALQAL